MIRLRDQIANFSVKSELHNELLWIVRDQPVIMYYMYEFIRPIESTWSSLIYKGKLLWLYFQVIFATGH